MPDGLATARSRLSAERLPAAPVRAPHEAGPRDAAPTLAVPSPVLNSYAPYPKRESTEGASE